VGFVNTHPIQYFTPLYAHINRSADLEAVPIFLSDAGLKPTLDPGFGHTVRWDIDLLEGLEAVFLPGAHRRRLNAVHRMVAPQLWREIRNGQYDAVVVHGPAIPANYVAMAAARSIGIPVFARSDSQLSVKRKRWPRLRRVLARLVYNRFDRLLAVGQANREFFLALGVPNERISMFPFAVDNERIIREARLGEAERLAVRERLGVRSGVPVVIYASKLQQRKHPDDLIEAARRLAREGIDFDVVIGGSGPMEAELKARAAAASELGVRLPGFLNQSEMPKVLGACDIFVLPAESEPWGLVVNEAMCAGLAIVASREVGAVPDLVKPGVNGNLFDAGDIAGLADALRPLLTDAGVRAEMQRQSCAIISKWSYDQCVVGLRGALIEAGVELPTFPE
jgi:glycosyltransferase involved in cell wall biosynthesis